MYGAQCSPSAQKRCGTLGENKTAATWVSQNPEGIKTWYITKKYKRQMMDQSIRHLFRGASSPYMTTEDRLLYSLGNIRHLDSLKESVNKQIEVNQHT